VSVTTTTIKANSILLKYRSMEHSTTFVPKSCSKHERACNGDCRRRMGRSSLLHSYAMYRIKCQVHHTTCQETKSAIMTFSVYPMAIVGEVWADGLHCYTHMLYVCRIKYSRKLNQHLYFEWLDLFQTKQYNTMYILVLDAPYYWHPTLPYRSAAYNRMIHSTGSRLASEA
jgi:hypothetical protein